MTTPAAANLYLAQHLHALEEKGYAIYNPNNLPIGNLPTIYGFNNGGSAGWLSAVAIAEDGTCLGGHCCSHEGYMRHDLGIFEGTRTDRHTDQYQPHYPNGYKMDFIPYEEVRTHEGLNKALKLNKEKQHDAERTASNLPTEN